MTDIKSYPKGDLRQMLSALAALDDSHAPTLLKIVARIGLDKKSVTSLLKQAEDQAGVVIEKDGAIYTLVDWGPIFKRKGAESVLDNIEDPDCNPSLRPKVL